MILHFEISVLYIFYCFLEWFGPVDCVTYRDLRCFAASAYHTAVWLRLISLALSVPEHGHTHIVAQVRIALLYVVSSIRV